MKFRFVEFNKTRDWRGAEAARVLVTDDDNDESLLWMSKQDIRRSVMLYGPHIGLMQAAAAYLLTPEQLVRSWQATGDKAFFRPMEPARDREGLWLHPDWPDLDEGEDAACEAWLELIGYESTSDLLADDDRDQSRDVKARWEAGDNDYLAWEPEPPAGEGWFLAAVFDTEDGPVATWLRQKPAAGAAA